MLTPGMVDPASWRGRIVAQHQAGFTWFGWLGAVDEIGRSDHFRVVVYLQSHAANETVCIATLVDRQAARLDSIADVFPGASWCEREATTDFGIIFDAESSADVAPRVLRKDHVLAARATATWPGAADPSEQTRGSRRRSYPPGVPDPAIWGTREPGDEPASAAVIAAAVEGVRRRR